MKNKNVFMLFLIPLSGAVISTNTSWSPVKKMLLEKIAPHQTTYSTKQMNWIIKKYDEIRRSWNVPNRTGWSTFIRHKYFFELPLWMEIVRDVMNETEEKGVYVSSMLEAMACEYRLTEEQKIDQKVIQRFIAMQREETYEPPMRETFSAAILILNLWQCDELGIKLSEELVSNELFVSESPTRLVKTPIIGWKRGKQKKYTFDEEGPSVISGSPEKALEKTRKVFHLKLMMQEFENELSKVVWQDVDQNSPLFFPSSDDSHFLPEE